MELQIGDIIGYKPKATDSLVSALIKIGGKLRYSNIIWICISGVDLN